MRPIRLILALLCAAAALLSGGGGALALENCVEPSAPGPVDGAAVTEDQMRGAAGAARSFIAQSDVYQACLADALNAARTQVAAEGKPLDPSLESAIRTKAAANQKLNEKVGAEINSAIGVYKETHLK